MKEKTYLTADGRIKVVAELEKLKGPDRENMAQRLRSAIEMGDLSENAEYISAKEDQGFLEGRIQELEYLVNNAIIIEEKVGKYDRVLVGATITVREDGSDPETYHLVGSKEADPLNGLISNESPIGSALLGHSVGDQVIVDTPGGAIKFKIVNIE